MTEKMLADAISALGIHTVAGIPDSTLKVFCDCVQTSEQFSHSVCANEGAALGIAIGSYLATGKPACVYMQNSGLGNIVNPFTSLAHQEVYGIPVLFIIGWRGDDTGHDEPQHKFMGRATLAILNTLEIPFSVVSRDTSDAELREIFQQAAQYLSKEEPFAVVVKRGTFEEHGVRKHQSGFQLTQETAVTAFLNHTTAEDVIVSTTGKISRELYEKLKLMPGRKGQAFLTVGGMGFASSIAMGIAREAPDKRVYCLDGDGAVLMHMGSLAVIGACGQENLVHICLNNQAYESVGGMATGVQRYSGVAEQCGYKTVLFVDSPDSLSRALETVRSALGPAFIEIGLANTSRKDLGRPKESAAENKRMFMEYHWKKAER